MNEPKQSSENSSPRTIPHGLGVDTCKASLVHVCFRAPGPGANIDWKSRFIPYGITMLFSGVIPTALAILAERSNLRPSSTIHLPILRDYLALFLGFVSVPLLIAFLWTERSLILD